jgi:hypothetical protein
MKTIDRLTMSIVYLVIVLISHHYLGILGALTAISILSAYTFSFAMGIDRGMKSDIVRTEHSKIMLVSMSNNIEELLKDVRFKTLKRASDTSSGGLPLSVEGLPLSVEGLPLSTEPTPLSVGGLGLSDNNTPEGLTTEVPDGTPEVCVYCTHPLTLFNRVTTDIGVCCVKCYYKGYLLKDKEEEDTGPKSEDSQVICYCCGTVILPLTNRIKIDNQAYCRRCFSRGYHKPKEEGVLRAIKDKARSTAPKSEIVLTDTEKDFIYDLRAANEETS